MNNATKILTAATLALAAMGAAQAETYHGVLTVNSVQSRAEVHAQGVVAAHGVNTFATAYGQGVTTVASSTDRSIVRSQAVAAAHSANPYATGYGQGVTQVRSSNVDRAAVRAEARANATSSVSM
ncbi:hypothetical protein [Variovorax sp. PAMC 28711]|uniref:hypothetical protein n=1 Tax=Variovorax sp. PAMC 28711 TaxID=1795631 RepID=UPI00078C3F9B|nr:hypothetical protein [Variovorax sp. PAMC 28711]AMM24182.1 hypothetical protein AX767_07335 [Variovorax sp. PAMC 28711]